jgi:hypothetical protein
VSYRCDVCQEVVAPRKPRLTHCLMKDVGIPPCTVRQIARELACCKTCHTMLGAGIPLAIVIRQRGEGATLEPPTKAAPKKVLQRVEFRGKIVTLWRAKQSPV